MRAVVQEAAFERDRLEFSLGDTLDVKSGILLAAITVLGTLTGGLLAISDLAKPLQTAQMISLGLLAIGACFTVWSIWPRSYLMPDMPEVYAGWMRELKEYYKDDAERAESEFEIGLTAKANERVERNHGINAMKSRWLFRAFVPTLIALLIDLGTLGYLGALKLLS